VHVIGHDNPSINIERSLRFGEQNGIPQSLYFSDQKIASPVRKIDGKEDGDVG
jgi:hypothetical protein